MAQRFSLMLGAAIAVSIPTPALASGPVAGDTLRGVVADSAGRPVGGATVRLDELSRSAATSADGAFVIGDLPAGRFTLLVRGIGYASVVLPVVVPASEPVHVVLRPTVFRMEAVTVTATGTALDPMSSPLPASSLGDEELRRTYTVSVAHALDQMAGVRTLSTGGEIGKPVIRGLSGARVLVLDGGHRLEDYSFSGEDGPSVESRFADRVEVIRGPASVLYGSDALGGVVNVIPAPLPDGPGSGGLELETYGALNNKEFGSLLRASGRAGSLGWRVAGTGRKSEALHTPAGELENTGFAAANGEGALGARGGWGRADLRVARYGGEFHLLEAADALNPAPKVPGQKEEGPVRKLSDDRIQLASLFPVGAGQRLEAKAQFQRHWLAEVVEGDTAANPLERGFDLLLNTASLDLLLHHASAGGVVGTIGASGVRQDNATRGDEALVPAAQVTTGGAFAFEQFTRGRWSVLAGARVDARRLVSQDNNQLFLVGQTRNHTPWAADFGLVFRPASDVALAGNVGRAWRAPSFFELFANGLEVGEARYTLGQPALRPEAAVNADLSLRWRSRRLRGEIAGYLNTISDFIYLAPTGTITGGGFSIYRYAQADARLWGGEASLEAQVKLTTVSVVVSYVNGTRTDNSEPLPSIPPLRALFSTEWRKGAGYFRVEMETVAHQSRLNPFDYPTRAYTLFHGGTGFEAPLGSRRVKVDLIVRNAVDARYRDFMSRYKSFALSQGRNIALRLSTEF